LYKQSLEYFSLDTTFDTSGRLLLARFKNSGLGIWVRILQALYREEGYFMAWDEESALLLAEELSEDVKTLNQLVSFCVDKGIFNNMMYEKYGILTSRRIQENFYHVSKRRKDVRVRADFVIFKPLLKFCQHNVSNNKENVNTMYAETSNMHTDLDKGKERKGKERKGKETIPKNENGSSSCSFSNNASPGDSFSQIANLYQQCGFLVNGTTADWIDAVLKDYGFEWVKRAIIESEKRGKIQKSYVEGILSNWKANGGMNRTGEKSANSKNSKTSSFHNFEQQFNKLSEEELENMARKNYFDLIDDDEDIEKIARKNV
jgi:DNA replication protein DnaD